MIRTEHGGLSVSFMEFIGFGIYFSIKKSVDRDYRSYEPVVSGSAVDRPWEGGRSSPALSVLALWARGFGAKAWGERGRLCRAHPGFLRSDRR
jgi:hypothetical protein